MPQTFPQPPNSTEVFKAQLEYYQQLKEYHRQQMVLAQEKFDRLKAFLELELSTPETHQTETSGAIEGTATSNTTVEASSSGFIVEENYSAHTSTSASDTDLECKSNQPSPTKVESKELSINDRAFETIDSPEIEVEGTDKIDSNDLEPIKSQDSSSLHISTIATTEAPLNHEGENNKKKEDDLIELQGRSGVNSPLKIEEQSTRLWQLVAAILDDNAPKPMYINEIYQAFCDRGLNKFKWKVTKESLGSTLSNYQKKKLWIREKSGCYRSLLSQKIPFISSEHLAVNRQITRTSTESKTNLNNTPTYQIIFNALRSVAPNPMNADDIVNWMYPQGVSSKIWQKTKESIAKALSQHLSKNLWERVTTGYYRIKDVEEKVAVVLPAQENVSEKESVKSQAQKSPQGLELDENEAIYLKIKHLNGYVGVVRAAMKDRADLITTPIDVCNWLDPNLSDSLKQELDNKFQKALARDAQRGKWERIDVRTYKYSSELNTSKNNNLSKQTALELSSASTKTISQQLKELTPLISELFESEGNGEILHLNYIGHTIFGTNYRDRLPQLLEMLALGQKQNLWVRVPEDPDCWTLDLSLLPTEEIEIIEEDSSAEPTLQPT